MRVLVTGGAGYIGSHTIVEALRAGHDVLVVDNFSNASRDVIARLGRLTNREVPVREVDIRDRAALDEVFDDFRPEAVIHFAGLKAVGESSQIPAKYYAVNVAGSINVIEALEQVGCTRLVFSSSATVYGDPQYLPIDELPLSASNPYGRSKLQVEDILRDQAAARPDWAIAILRYFNPVGAHDSGLIGETPSGTPNNLMPYVAQVASGEREYLSVFGHDYDTCDGTGVRDYIHVVDLAAAHVAALRWHDPSISASATARPCSRWSRASRRPAAGPCLTGLRRDGLATWHPVMPTRRVRGASLDGRPNAASMRCARAGGSGSADRPRPQRKKTRYRGPFFPIERR